MTAGAEKDDAQEMRGLPRPRTSDDSVVPDQPSLAYLLQEGHRLQSRQRRRDAAEALSRSSARLGALLVDENNDLLALSSVPRARSYSPSSRSSQLIAQSLRAARRVLDNNWEPEEQDVPTPAIVHESESSTETTAPGDSANSQQEGEDAESSS